MYKQSRASNKADIKRRASVSSFMKVITHEKRGGKTVYFQITRVRRSVEVCFVMPSQ